MTLRALIIFLITGLPVLAFAGENSDAAVEDPQSTQESDNLETDSHQANFEEENKSLEKPTGDPTHIIATLKADALRLLFAGHLLYVAGVPVEYGEYAWDAAHDVSIDPYILAALLISEESGRLKDFSIETAPAQKYSFEYHPTTEGRGGERGIYQIKPRWARKAGKYYGEDWNADSLWDPWINTRVAAFLVVHLTENHKKSCVKARDKLHEIHVELPDKTVDLDFVAHYKCVSKVRNIIDPRTRCRYAQKKFEKLFISLHSVQKPDLKAIGKAHNEKKAAQLAKIQKNEKRKLRHKLRDLRKELGLEVKYHLIKEMTLEELRFAVKYLRENN